MARLPSVGGDEGTWGTVLNDFLLVEHNPDGTLKPSGSLAAKADTSSLAPVATSGDYDDLANTPPPAPVDSVNGQTGVVVLDASDVGLGNVDNTSDADKPISTATQTALDSKVDDADFDQALEDHTPGIELGYAERTTSFATAVNADITGLSVTVTGKGRPADVEFFCSAAYHSVSGTFLRADVKMGGTILQSWMELTSSTGFGRSCYIKARVTLTEGVSYTFTVSTFLGTAGTMTWFASASPARPMSLSVVSR